NAFPAERVIRRAVRGQMLKPLLRLADRRQMTGRHPPRDEMRCIHCVEPFRPPAIKALVHRLPDKALQRFDVFPNREIDRHVPIVEGTKIGGVVALVLEPPHKALRALGQSIHEVEIVHEIGHARIVGPIVKPTDVELCEVARVVHSSYSAASVTGGGSKTPMVSGLAVYRSIRRSISGRKWRSKPCTGQAAPSPKAQIV